MAGIRFLERAFESHNPADTREIVGTAPAPPPKMWISRASRAGGVLNHGGASRIKRGEYIDQLAQLIKRDLNALSNSGPASAASPLTKGALMW